MSDNQYKPEQYHEPFKPREEMSWDEFIRRVENSCNNNEKITVIVDNNDCVVFHMNELVKGKIVSKDLIDERIKVCLIIQRKPIE